MNTDPQTERHCSDWELIQELHSLAGRTILELGCGRAELTRKISEVWPTSQILALEVDETQHALNLGIRDLTNVRFELAGAESIPVEDDSVDAVFMFKSLHHVPIELMDLALTEVARVLRPGGLAHISEPLFRGEFNEILRLFHDEQRVRAAASCAIQDAVATCRLEQVNQIHFLAPVLFEDYAAFEDRILGVTHTRHDLSDELLAEVEARFRAHLTPTGAHFLAPARLDLLMKPHAS